MITKTTFATERPVVAGNGERIRVQLERLASDDGIERAEARRFLAALGGAAVPGLIRALHDTNHRMRWEAAKALAEAPNAMAAPALTEALDDDAPDVRWLAAEALIATGENAIEPLLRAIIDRSDSRHFRDGAHHVLRELSEGRWGPVLIPVLKALDTFDATERSPVAAFYALRALRDRQRKGSAVRGGVILPSRPRSA